MQLPSFITFLVGTIVFWGIVYWLTWRMSPAAKKRIRYGAILFAIFALRITDNDLYQPSLSIALLIVFGSINLLGLIGGLALWGIQAVPSWRDTKVDLLWFAIGRGYVASLLFVRSFSWQSAVIQAIVISLAAVATYDGPMDRDIYPEGEGGG